MRTVGNVLLKENESLEVNGGDHEKYILLSHMMLSYLNLQSVYNIGLVILAFLIWKVFTYLPSYAYVF